jgi:hypothetical protein
MVHRRDDLLTSPKERAIEAVKAGEKHQAIQAIEDLYEMFHPLHDRYGDWMVLLLSFIGEKLGEDAVEEATRRGFNQMYNELFVNTFRKMNPEEIARALCLVHKTHYSDHYVEEDEEKFVIVIRYCGSGGRMQKHKIGGTTCKAYPWSYNQRDVNYYCCHESVFNLAFQELKFEKVRFEFGRQFDSEGKPTGEPCRYIVYK